MRLFEFAEDSGDPESILASILQNLRLDMIEALKNRPKKEAPPPISYETIIDLVRDGGNPYFNQQVLEMLLNSPGIQSMIDSVGNKEVTLKLAGNEPATVERPSQIPPEKKVEMMAQRAMSRRQ